MSSGDSYICILFSGDGRETGDGRWRMADGQAGKEGKGREGKERGVSK